MKQEIYSQTNNHNGQLKISKNRIKNYEQNSIINLNKIYKNYKLRDPTLSLKIKDEVDTDKNGILPILFNKIF